jgi:hypothetical protein
MRSVLSVICVPSVSFSTLAVTSRLRKAMAGTGRRLHRPDSPALLAVFTAPDVAICRALGCT